MRRSTASTVLALAVLVGACSSDDRGSSPSSAGADVDASASADATPAESGSTDTGTAPVDAADAGNDAATDADADAPDPNACSWSGAPGECMTVSACAAMADHSSFAGSCPGPTAVECCIDTPDVADNPPVPTGYKLMAQSQVTPAMTTWAVSILNDPAMYPMYGTVTQVFGTQTVLARVEWHPPDFQNSVVHRGVTLYVPG